MTTIPTTVTTAELPALLEAGPVTIRVADHGDPCGMRKIARQLEAAYPHDTPITTEPGSAWTQGRWMLAFGGEFVQPMLLVTSVDASYELTDAAPEPSRPCQMCQRHAATMAAEAATGAAGEAGRQP